MTRWMRAALVAASMLWSGEAGASEPEDDPYVAIAIPETPRSMNPIRARNTVEEMVSGLLDLPLLDVRRRDDGRLVFEPGLAHTATVHDDRMGVTLDLRDDVRWSDGTPVRAEDVTVAWRLAADRRSGSLLRRVAELLDGLPQSDGPLRVVFRFKAPHPPELLLFTASRLYAPSHQMRSLDPRFLGLHQHNARPLATASLRLVQYGPFTINGLRQVDLARNSQFTGPPAWDTTLPDVMLGRAPHSENHSALVGEVHAILDVPAEYISASRYWPGRTIQTGAYEGYLAIYTLDRPLVADPRIRRAIALAVDVERIMREDRADRDGHVWAHRMTGPVAPALRTARSRQRPIPCDPDQARAILEEAGWTDSDGDGIRDRDGTPLRLVLRVPEPEPMTFGASEYLLHARSIQRDLRSVGIEVERTFSGESDMFLFRGIFSPYPNPGFSFSSDGPANWFGYHNERVDELIARGDAATRPRRSDRLYRRAQKLIYADQPALFLYWPEPLMWIHSAIDIPDDSLHPLRDLHRWKVDLDGLTRPERASQ